MLISLSFCRLGNMFLVLRYQPRAMLIKRNWLDRISDGKEQSFGERVGCATTRTPDLRLDHEQDVPAILDACRA